MKKTVIIISILLTFGALATLYFKPFAKTEIIILEHLTEHDKDDKLDQICLVKNPPNRSQTLRELIDEFNHKNSVKEEYKRLFVKPHDYDYGIIFPYNVDYEAKTTTRNDNDLDNINFLGYTSVFEDYKGDTIKITEVHVSEISYYKK